MSWLFDQLTDLAVAHRVDVVVCVDLSSLPSGPGSIDVPELVGRAACLPRTTLLLLPASQAEATSPLDSPEVIDMDVRHPKSPARAAMRMLADHGCHRGAILRAGDGRMSLEPSGRLPQRDRVAADVATLGIAAWVFATDEPSTRIDPVDEPYAAGLRISIGSMTARSNVMIADVTGFVSLLEALVTLREFALDTQPSSPGEGVHLSIVDAC